MKAESREIVQHILGYIGRFSAGDVTEAESEASFQEAALKLFRYQFQHNAAYKKYCQARRKSPLTVRDWREIPPIPIQAFKELTLSCEPAEEAEAVFMTSGTTNADKRGKHYHPTLEVWDASMVPPFKHYVLPDRDRITVLVLSPAADLNRNSSLSRYLTKAVEHYGTSGSRYFYSQENGLDMEGVLASLQECTARNEPVLLIGATFAYVHLLDYCADHSFQVELPQGSRLFDTGGLKGQSREITAEELYRKIEDHFGLNRESCVNMYGMTELSSQIYDQTIRSRVLTGRAVHEKANPPWIRTLVLNPDTLEPAPDGETGVLAHYDLGNWNSAFAVLTEDMGYKNERGLVLLGRIKGSEARGCSIAIDQLMSSHKKQVKA
ncbi:MULTISPECIES: CoF synthetase [Paenibacillus]|uniref:Acyl-protein synthetase LuxE n=1 Tax=Paenibacillus naphthalenovorans TaxID=162209 RepID=A0A0U2UEJ2_9BACL|nr:MULTISPECIES: CoF synthetase [Paenibacillus]ALS24648.1 acyl-protein synthetase LuxE [Paenibacillus naphthalenovorans]NTZ16140.1 CoF synthetase [Paenibacillus sp. JMULE4]SDJ69363.1 Acyl-protein synthetase, LuxE [Paenibacillus naphthalenovorans]